jgi:cyclase
LGDQTLVFDPFLTPAAAHDLRLVAESITGKPVSFVVNSHYHNDHIRGNQVFAPGATIISAEWTRNAILEKEQAEIEWEKQHAPPRLAELEKTYQSASEEERKELLMWIGYYRGMIDSHSQLTTTLPTLTFDGKLVLYGAGRTVEVRETGEGHTPSDLVLFLPNEKIVFMGDLIFVERHPWLGDGFPDKWKETLQQINDWSITTVVPGHGPVSGSEQLLTMAGYLAEFIGLAKAAIDNGETEDELARQTLPQRYDHWWYGRFVAPNLRFLYRSLSKQ